MSLTTDPQLGNRDGWLWCPQCAGIKPPAHAHDEFEGMGENELRAAARALSARLAARSPHASAPRTRT